MLRKSLTTVQEKTKFCIFNLAGSILFVTSLDHLIKIPAVATAVSCTKIYDAER